VRTQTISDAIAGVRGMFIRFIEGPNMIIIDKSTSTVEGCDSNGEIKDQFNWISVKVHK